MEKHYNMKSPGVKRLMREAMELRDPTPMYYAQPLEDNLFEWHFTILAPQGTDYEGGRYHGRIILPTEYPMKPPSIIMLTPNGRFEIHHKICLSASAYHPESWQPSWSIRTVLLALIGFMPTEGGGAIGSVDMPSADRRRLAQCSLEWVCPTCGIPNKDILPRLNEGREGQEKAMEEVADIVTQMAFKSESEVKAQKKKMSQEESQRTKAVAVAASQSPPHTSRDSTGTSLTTTTTTSTTNGPRQRLHPDAGGMQGVETVVASPAANVSVVPPTVRRATIQATPVHDMQRQSGRGVRSWVLIWLLLFAIGVLMARRIYMHVLAS